ncbi:MAG: hypothetical protein JRI23_27015 [Deltaproteobacteria bacterium]|jgi:hypothetical protein|nr:hypothetical protein [Deltaproteobacteria bacterium]MBW2535724.1 hypothetical protein [Deltaproteobacteria bacterium]
MKLRESLRKGMYLLGSMLVGRGVTSEHLVQEALGEQQRRKQKGSPHKRLGQLLIEMSAVSNEDLDQALAEQRKARQTTEEEPAEPRVVGQAAEAGAAVPEVIQAEVDGERPTAAKEPSTEEKDDSEAQPRFVASAKGVVFHTPDCLAAKKIGASNRMTFSSPEEAEAAGKRACSKCC